jgi:hypothetical protein
LWLVYFTYIILLKLYIVKYNYIILLIGIAYVLTYQKF